MVCVLTLLAGVSSAAQSGLAGRWTGDEPGHGNVSHPVSIVLVVKGEEATGTISIGEDPVKTVTDGKVQGATVTFTTPSRMNGRDITITWHGELKDDRLTFTRRLGGGPEMPPLSLRRAAP
jgi:hypothetical protein